MRFILYTSGLRMVTYNVMQPSAYLEIPKLDDEISWACRFDRNSEKLRNATFYFAFACVYRM